MEYRMNRNEILPAGAFLATRYLDPHRDFITRRVYYENGLIKAFDGKEWWTVCKINNQQIENAKDAVMESGLMTAKDLAVENCYDTAILTFAWCINDKKGMVTNFSYPAVEHPAIEKLEESLDQIESLSSRSMEES